jgi:hypothetical protein
VDADLNATLDTHPYGPNQQFMAILHSSLFSELRNTANYFFLMEPDTFPIRSMWLTTLDRETLWDGQGQWWGKGANYEGTLREADSIDYRIHINGNGLWSTSRSFAAYTKGMYESPWCPGWDHELFCYLSHDWRLYRDVMHRWRYSRFLINLWHINWETDDVLIRYPLASFIHGKQRDGIRTMQT